MFSLPIVLAATAIIGISGNGMVSGPFQNGGQVIVWEQGVNGVKDSFLADLLGQGVVIGGINCPLPGFPVQPDFDVPGGTLPDFNIPGEILPDFSIPGGTHPDFNIPGGNLPDNSLPDNSLPDNNQPDTNLPGNPDGGESSQDSFVSQVVELVNAERAKAGIAPLTADVKAEAAAAVRAREIETSFSHTRPNGSQFSTALTEQGVNATRSGENIAWGQRTPQEVVSTWMNSDGHRANILNPGFHRIGVGHFESDAGVHYWTQLFTN